MLAGWVVSGHVTPYFFIGVGIVALVQYVNVMKVNQSFRSLLPELRSEERTLLAESLRTGQREPIVVWKEKGFILDGHNRFEILGKEARTKEISLPDETAAELWIINNQLGRRNLHANHYAYYLGKKYEAEKKGFGGDRKSSGQSGHLNGRTADRMENQTGAAEKTIRRNAAFARGVDKLEMASPGAKHAILNGKTNLGKGEIATIAKAADAQVEELAKTIKNGKPIADAARQKLAATEDPWRDVYCFHQMMKEVEKLRHVPLNRLVSFVKGNALGRSYHKNKSLLSAIRFLVKLEKSLRKATR